MKDPFAPNPLCRCQHDTGDFDPRDPIPMELVGENASDTFANICYFIQPLASRYMDDANNLNIAKIPEMELALTNALTILEYAVRASIPEYPHHGKTDYDYLAITLEVLAMLANQIAGMSFDAECRKPLTEPEDDILPF